ncbi:MAG: nitroreductase [Aeromicrobium sp.]|nr:nitroreductase [Aeromicrobium sp.]
MALQGTYEPGSTGWVNDHVDQYERSGGREGTLHEGDRIVVLTTVGVKSGHLRKTPVMRVEHDGEYVVVGSRGGAPQDPGWCANIRRHPHVELQDETVVHECDARELEGAERDVWWQRCVETFSNYGDYQQRTDRLIPLFLLVPTASRPAVPRP